MIILGIDTSCDDTCISILQIANGKLQIVSNVVSSQVKLHAKYGGVYPSLAKREHQRNLAPVLKKALEEARLLNSKFKNQNAKIDAIGVTVGPGLEPCLWQGVNFAKKLAEDLKLQIIPVNHIEAHILANFIGEEIKNQKSTTAHFQWAGLPSPASFRRGGAVAKIKNYFPAVCLVVSGGHTQLILMNGIGKYKLIGETRDDAAGECFDKVARILGLGYPGGPAIAKEAENYTGQTCVTLPRPMIYQKNYDFSFSGLKTAVLYDFKSQLPEIRQSKQYIRAMAAEVQQAIIDVLIQKTLRAAKNYRAKSIILGGGVAANDELRKQFGGKIKKELSNIQYLTPNIQYCTDNAAMVAATAYFHQKTAAKDLKKIKANANLKI